MEKIYKAWKNPKSIETPQISQLRNDHTIAKQYKCININ